jgi:hypothetical protein
MLNITVMLIQLSLFRSTTKLNKNFNILQGLGNRQNAQEIFFLFLCPQFLEKET